MSKTVGIDHGTFKLCAYYMDISGKSHTLNLIPFLVQGANRRTVPSCVTYLESGVKIVGEYVPDVPPQRMVMSPKRFLGCNQIEASLFGEGEHLQFTMAENGELAVKIRVEEIDYCILVGGSVRVPAAADVARRIFSDKVKTDLDARSVVALGAASRAVVAPVLPMDFGVALHDGGFHRILKAGTPYPCSAQGEYVPAEEYACEFEIDLREGSSSLAKENRQIEVIEVDILYIVQDKIF